MSCWGRWPLHSGWRSVPLLPESRLPYSSSITCSQTPLPFSTLCQTSTIHHKIQSQIYYLPHWSFTQHTMGWSAENILALLTLAITIPTSIIGTCALLNWWRQRQMGKKTKCMYTKFNFSSPLLTKAKWSRAINRRPTVGGSWRPGNGSRS
jgi:hypothetical protein